MNVDIKCVGKPRECEIADEHGREENGVEYVAGKYQGSEFHDLGKGAYLYFLRQDVAVLVFAD